MFVYGNPLDTLNTNSWFNDDEDSSNVDLLFRLGKDDEFVLLDQKTKFIINDNNYQELFVSMDYNTGMINGKIDITTIKTITIIKPTEILGNRTKELGKKGMRIGAISGFFN